MKNTTQGVLISLINKQIFKYRISLLLCNTVTAVVVAFLFFWLFTPIWLAVYITKSNFPVFGWPCLIAFYFNIRLIAEDNYTNKWLDNRTSKRNELRYNISEEKHFKYLLKLSLKEKLGFLEYYELRKRLKDIDIDIKELPFIKTDAPDIKPEAPEAKQFSLFDAIEEDAPSEEITVHTVSTKSGYYKSTVERSEENSDQIDKWLDKSANCLFEIVTYINDEPESIMVTKEVFDAALKQFAH